MSTLRDNVTAALAPVPLALALAAFAAGYGAHKALAPAAVVVAAKPKTPRRERGRADSVGSATSEGGTDTDSDFEDEAAAAAADLGALKPGSDEIKLVLVVNDSLKMTKGKIGAQCGHATLACYETLAKSNARLVNRWKMYGQPKICLKAASTEELDAMARQARSLNLCARTIQDAGRTQVAPGSKTVLGIGPGPARLINQVTGKLKLL